MGKIKTRFALLVIGSMVFCLIAFVPVHATCVQGEQACSSKYAVGNVFFGSGGSLDSACSTNYCAKQALGETGIGITGSTNYKAQAGFNVDRTPYLQFNVTTTNVSLGDLSTISTATATATFSVEAYLASGYSVVTASSPPQYSGHTLTALSTTPTASSVGTEQFGMNLVSNTTACGAPANFGANPAQVPSSAFSYGQVASDYDQCGKFFYSTTSPGNEIAYSNESSGIMDFTISYIANINSTTPAGLYTMSQVLVATPTF